MIKRLLNCLYDGINKSAGIYVAVGFCVLVALCIAFAGLPKVVYAPLVVILVGLWMFGPALLGDLIFDYWSTVVYRGSGKLHVKNHTANHGAPGFEAAVTVEAPGIPALHTVIRHGNAQYLSGLADSHDVELTIKTTPRGEKWVELIRLPGLRKVIIRGDFMQDEA